MNRNAANLAEKLESLSPELIAEVEDFVEFVRLRSEQRMLARAAAAASVPSFEAIWNNPEDSAYDAL
jgi:hypothetical protein